MALGADAAQRRSFQLALTSGVKAVTDSGGNLLIILLLWSMTRHSPLQGKRLKSALASEDLGLKT
jgi:hypothetical protein